MAIINFTPIAELGSAYKALQQFFNIETQGGMLPSYKALPYMSNPWGSITVREFNSLVSYPNKIPVVLGALEGPNSFYFGGVDTNKWKGTFTPTNGPVDLRVTVSKSPSLAPNSGASESAKISEKTAVSAAARSEYIFAPGTKDEKSLQYSQGAETNVTVTDGLSTTNSTGGEAAITSTVTVGSELWGLEASVAMEFRNNWSKSSTVDFSKSSTTTKSDITTLTRTIDLNSTLSDATGVYKYGDTVLVPGHKYIVELAVKQTTVDAPMIGGLATITGPAKTFSAGDIFTDSITGPAAVVLGSLHSDKTSNFQLTQSNPDEIQTALDGKVVSIIYTQSSVNVAPKKTISAAMSSIGIETSDGSATVNNLSNDGSGLIVRSLVNSSDLSNVNTPNNSLIIDLTELSKKNQGNSIFLDLSNEDQFKGRFIVVSGEVKGDHIIVGDLNHRFLNLTNSIVEAGSGYNEVVLNENSVGNSFYLGGGGDTVNINGYKNYIDAGAGNNVFIVRGTGTNYIDTGAGADILKLTSKTAEVIAHGWNFNEDRVEIAGDLIGTKIEFKYDPILAGYQVLSDGAEVAYLFAKDTAIPNEVADGIFQGTKVTPVDLNSKSEAFVAQIYAEAFDRAPEKAGIDYWSSLLNGSLSKTDFIKSVFTSAEFTNAHQSNGDFVNELYIDLFGRSAETAGQQAWVKALDAGLARAAVVDAFTHSAEFVQLVGQAAPVAAASVALEAA